MGYVIKDWANNVKFNGKTFKDYEDADAYLESFIAKNYYNTPINKMEWDKIEVENNFYNIKSDYILDYDEEIQWIFLKLNMNHTSTIQPLD